jgi:hypothetical protein
VSAPARPRRTAGALASAGRTGTIDVAGRHPGPFKPGPAGAFRNGSFQPAARSAGRLPGFAPGPAAYRYIPLTRPHVVGFVAVGMHNDVCKQDVPTPCGAPPAAWQSPTLRSEHDPSAKQHA